MLTHHRHAANAKLSLLQDQVWYTRRLLMMAPDTCLHPRAHSSSTMAEYCVIQMNPYTYLQQNTSRKILKTSTCTGSPVLSNPRPIQSQMRRRRPPSALHGLHYHYRGTPYLEMTSCLPAASPLKASIPLPSSVVQDEDS